MGLVPTKKWKQYKTHDDQVCFCTCQSRLSIFYSINMTEVFLDAVNYKELPMLLPKGKFAKLMTIVITSIDCKYVSIETNSYMSCCSLIKSALLFHQSCTKRLSHKINGYLNISKLTIVWHLDDKKFGALTHLLRHNSPPLSRNPTVIWLWSTDTIFCSNAGVVQIPIILYWTIMYDFP